MSDYHERACRECGSFLHHEDDCRKALAAVKRVEVVERWVLEHFGEAMLKLARPRIPSLLVELAAFEDP